MLKRGEDFIMLLMLLLLQAVACKATTANAIKADSLEADASADTLKPTAVKWMTTATRPFQKKKKRKKRMSFLRAFIRGFNDLDTNYIEPQHYNFTIMLENVNTYEMYRVSNRLGQSIVFAPEPSIRIGPYFGWRWMFLGYTIDVKHIDLGGDDNQRQEYDLSLYSSQLGLDLFYRKTGNNYKIRRMELGKDVDLSAMRNVEFGGFRSSIKGFNGYYIFNHRKFSYPAAFSQSTVQKRSAGSAMIGVGYTVHSLSVDWDKLNKLVSDRVGPDVLLNSNVDSTLTFGSIKYRDFNINGGYGYNWVFAKHWLLSISMSVGLAYNHTIGNIDQKKFSWRNFKLSNLSIDGVGRLGIVWNNNKWYFGLSSVMHAYNYHKKEFATNNLFGNVILYFGMNFGKKKAYRNKD